MQSRDYRDLIGGSLLIIGGVSAAGHAYLTLPLGTLRNAGPGMFPMILGVLLFGFGAAIAIPAFVRRGPPVVVEVGPSFFVLASIAAFALTVRSLGLAPAIIALVVVASMAQTNLRPISVLGLCLVLCLLAWLIFQVGLNVPLAMFRTQF